jgi:DNA polymerase elongation subunit (family B)
MGKLYGKRIRLSPREVEVVEKFREGNVQLKIPLKIHAKLPKVLLLDIETAPLSAFLWRLKTDYVSPAMLQNSNWWMLSWSAKWLFDSEMMNDVVTPNESIEEDDKRIAASLWKLVNEADIIISHNGKNFDHKMLNMRWMMHDFMPPSPYRIIDTYQVARSNFLFPSYGLDFIAQQLGVGAKVKHEGFGMWKKCLMGEEEALKNMVEYNDMDVFILEDVYLVFRPWIKNHPSMGVYMESETPVCSGCGSVHLEECGSYKTNVSNFKNFRCQECGSPHNRQRTSAIPLSIRKKLLTGIPG